jgi:hypothetical protein
MTGPQMLEKIEKVCVAATQQCMPVSPHRCLPKRHPRPCCVQPKITHSRVHRTAVVGSQDMKGKRFVVFGLETTNHGSTSFRVKTRRSWLKSPCHYPGTVPCIQFPFRRHLCNTIVECILIFGCGAMRLKHKINKLQVYSFTTLSYIYIPLKDYSTPSSFVSSANLLKCPAPVLCPCREFVVGNC